ncbi:MAG: septum formation initiator family protein [Candidatus Moranbacteria bacterium]|jgi:cell division protein FtsB|nr:septum formation initiator family protein [Candidatus Moranbacteria bacterium]
MRIFYIVSFFLILLGVLAFFSIPTLKEMKRSKVIESEISSLQSEAEKLSAENNFLREKIDYLKSDYYKESVAKDRLSLRNMGEKIVVVQPNSTNSDNSESKKQDISSDKKVNDNEYQESLPNYMKWWNVVKGDK